MYRPENLVASAPIEPLVLGDIPDPALGTAAHEAASVRAHATRDISAMPWLPQLPDNWMGDIYDRIEAAERHYVAPHLRSEEYELGTAKKDDDIAHVPGKGSFLFTAPHATKTIRFATGKLGFADRGTGGMTAVLAEEHGDGFIMTGRQTSSPVSEPHHPLKDAILPYVEDASGFIDVHACASHLFVQPTDTYNLHASIGLGEAPSEALREFAHAAMRYAREELGLYVVVGNEQDYYSQMSTTELKRNGDGTAYRNRLAGVKPNMLNNYVRRQFASAGKVAAALQVELSAFNHIGSVDSDKRDRCTQIVAVALGYKFLSHLVDQAVSDPPETL